MDRETRKQTLRQAIEATRRELGLPPSAPVDPQEVLKRNPPLADLADYIKDLLKNDPGAPRK